VATEVIMPALELVQDTGRVVRWLKSEGDEVSSGEALIEIETDKVTVEIEAPASGLLSGVRAREGEDVPVGEVIALILSPGEAPPSGDGAASRSSPVEPAGAGGAEPSRKLASPLARRRAREAGVDVATVEGTGPGGAVTAADLDAAVAHAEQEPSAGEPARVAGPGDPVEQRITPGPVWRRMAERTTASWTRAPHFYLFRDVRADRLSDWHDTFGDEVSLTDLLVRLVAEALARHPEANARWEEGTVIRPGEVNVGIAVAVDEGLVVPVVRGAEGLSVPNIAERRRALVDRARRGALKPEDVRGGTFTVSNLGMYGIDAFAAIVNGPQAAILSVGRMADRVIALDGRPAVAPCIGLGLSCDHRALDGARAARFLETLAGLIEEPFELLR
jgi:pyruvate dehydrogenase E2 component (dihydrolipoyllysine-residue acetyltransferase)